MSKIHIIPSEFNQSLELQLAYSIKAGFPSPAEDYPHDTLDFNRDSHSIILLLFSIFFHQIVVVLIFFRTFATSFLLLESAVYSF